ERAESPRGVRGASPTLPFSRAAALASEAARRPRAHTIRTGWSQGRGAPRSCCTRPAGTGVSELRVRHIIEIKRLIASANEGEQVFGGFDDLGAVVGYVFQPTEAVGFDGHDFHSIDSDSYGPMPNKALDRNGSPLLAWG